MCVCARAERERGKREKGTRMDYVVISQVYVWQDTERM